MPLTFPSHAAAVLPWCRARGWLPPSALIVGSTAPDLAYLLDTKLNFHLWPALLWPCLPVAFVTWLLFEVLLLPWLAVMLAEMWGDEASQLAQTRGPPREGRGVAAALLALAVGALTHVAWDGFTHANRWPASALYRGVEVGPLFVNQWLQLLSHVVGLVIVGVAVARLTPNVRWSRPRWTPRLAWLLGTLALAEAFAFALLLARRSQLPPGLLFGGAWLTFWWAARGVLVTFVLFGVAFRVSASVHRRGATPDQGRFAASSDQRTPSPAPRSSR